MKFHKSERGESIAYYIFMLAIFVIAILWYPVMGSIVQIDQAQKVAHANLSPNAEIGTKSIWFVNWKGCDRTDVALFNVLPYTGQDGKVVNNAIICSGFPFKGMTVRFK